VDHGKLKLTLHPPRLIWWTGQRRLRVSGFHFHKRMVRKTGKLLPYFWPGQKAMKAVRSKIGDRRYSRNDFHGEDMGELTSSPGWRNYFLSVLDEAAESLGSLSLAANTPVVLAHHQGTRAARRARCSHLVCAAEWSTSTCRVMRQRL